MKEKETICNAGELAAAQDSQSSIAEGQSATCVEAVAFDSQSSIAEGRQAPCPHCAKTKVRPPEELQRLNNRLKRMEGQLRGIQKMLENDAYCTDILTQVTAVQSGLNAFNRELLEEHIRTCVVTELQQGDTEVIGDLVKTIHKLMK